MKARPQFSVVIPYCNRLPYLERALRALSEQDVSLEDFEIVIACLEYSEPLARVLSSLPLGLRARCIMTREGWNTSRARNLAMAHAEGEVLLLLDADMLVQTMQSYNDRLSVLTAPADMLPLDIVASEDINRIIEAARASFDFVIIDMPRTVISWTEAVLHQSHVYFVPIELDMRSAQNTLRLIRALKAEDLPFQKLRYVLNRAPKFTDLSAKGRVKRLAESLDISIEIQLPDGGKQVTQANDHGQPLAQSAPKLPLRKEIQKLAKSLSDLNKAADTGRA